MSRFVIKFGVVLAALFAVIAIACGDDSGVDPTPVAVASPTAAPLTGTVTVFAAAPLTGTVTVFAAASLTDAFGELFTEFKKTNPGVEITPQFAGSPALRTQLEQGARADVYASADLPQMQMAL